MLYLEFMDGQGLGNQLWNYVTLRSLSNKLGYEFEIINPNKFKGKSFLQISYSTNKVRKKKFSGSHNLKIFREKLFYDKSDTSNKKKHTFEGFISIRKISIQ